MARIFLPPELLIPEQITITGDVARYLSLVLRVKLGDHLIVFDGSGFKYDCTILKSHKKEVIAEKIKKEPYSVESNISITLAQGIAKGEKMDLIIQKATELGVSKVIPLITEHSEVRHTEKINRWRKISLSASQQSGRDKVPQIDEPVSYKVFLYPSLEEGKGGSLKTGLIFSESRKERNLKQALKGFQNIKQITLLVGPEGGFSKEEITAAVEKGFIEVSLGPRILRTETAPITAISIIQYELGDIG
ncbi:MAG: 16S rRNA (uracil(1498)-N(3))-methyltransferase [Nitrospirae bacterium]|nr:16S rRNA (uracil(1498)-N(3))-methyltransferase [Nitrospirota bacterium]